MTDHSVSQTWLDIADSLSRRLSTDQARLYSAFAFAREKQPIKIAWTRRNTEDRFDDAVRLLRAAASLTNDTPNVFVAEDIRPSVERARLRAAELLEWIAALPERPYQRSTRLLAAAAYQVAGYPARASAIIATAGDDSAMFGSTEGIVSDSEILSALLAVDLPNVEQRVVTYWSQRRLESPSSGIEEASIVGELLVEETVRALGVLAAAMRWGDDGRLSRVLQKFVNLRDAYLHGDPIDWLLAALCAEVIHAYTSADLRHHIAQLMDQLDPVGQLAMERYVRRCYIDKRALAWPTQQRGIAKLMQHRSFALCTPTGSGKTAVAELALLYSLFEHLSNELGEQSTGTNDGNQSAGDSARLVLYLTPSRALAAEIERKLAQVLNGLTTTPIVVTGLYGGTDWGPTDAWLTSDWPAVLICTYHKAEALLRFLGPLFARRIALVVIDEAHNIVYQPNNKRSARESTAWVLESIVSRLLGLRNDAGPRVIALSAVAGNAEYAIARWAEGNIRAIPVTSTRRSTRQLVGRLHIDADRQFRISYDRLDGEPMQFSANRDDTPYIPFPIAQCPDYPKWNGPDTCLRAPLLWAAMHFGAAQRPTLIAIPQRIEDWADAFLELLDSSWAAALPASALYIPPTDADGDRFESLQSCLEACEDYFGRQSLEYRLLERGIVMHHAKMPGPMGRLLTTVIRDRIANIVMATSTLSEGVNLPFEIILLPSIMRGNVPLSASEFANLVGRAGRPGYAAEGQTLVLYTERVDHTSRNGYFFKRLRSLSSSNTGVDDPHEEETSNGIASSPVESALAVLLTAVETRWRAVVGSGALARDFHQWLETTSPLTGNVGVAEDAARETLDAVDHFVLAAVVELEAIRPTVDDTMIEHRLRAVWQRSFAFAARVIESDTEDHLLTILTRRGRAVRHIYPSAVQRRRLYRSTLPPKAATELIDTYDRIRQVMQIGNEYIRWERSAQFDYIRAIVAELRRLTFLHGIDAHPPQGTWEEALAWWLRVPGATVPRTTKQISKWFGFIKDHVIYRACWGIGSVTGLAIADVHGDESRAATLDDWPRTGLPWIVFWLKEVLTWGTLDPVAAFLLGRQRARTRAAAEIAALTYYNQMESEAIVPTEWLDARRIRVWGSSLYARATNPGHKGFEYPVVVEWPFTERDNSGYHVYPSPAQDRLNWIDPAGHILAYTPSPWEGFDDNVTTWDYHLNWRKRTVNRRQYLVPDYTEISQTQLGGIRENG